MILGVTLLKNEDIWIKKVLINLMDFCDDFLIIDNGSTDGTNDIIRDLGLDVILEQDLAKTHEMVEKYIGKDVWVQGFGGDEIYDPGGLSFIKDKLDPNVFQYYPKFLHATKVGKNTALGYLSPPAYSPGKLYNFKLLESWKSKRTNHIFLETGRVLKPNVISKNVMFNNMSWDTTPYRCIHTRFMRRSTLENDDFVGGKLNPADILGKNAAGDFGPKEGYNARLKYAKGKLTRVNIEGFFI